MVLKIMVRHVQNIYLTLGNTIGYSGKNIYIYWYIYFITLNAVFKNKIPIFLFLKYNLLILRKHQRMHK